MCFVDAAAWPRALGVVGRAGAGREGRAEAEREAAKASDAEEGLAGEQNQARC
jgi:hypothetical protein